MLLASAAATTVADNVKEQVHQGVNYIDKLQDFALAHGPSLVMGIVVFLIGRYIAGVIKNIADRMMAKANYDHTVISFVGQIIYYSILIIVLMTALGVAGFPTNSFLAAFGALGLAVGLALQNNLSNFASGLLILIFKPFKAGDWITINDVSGTVTSIQFMSTTIVTKESRTIFIPNSMLTTSQVTNSTYGDTRYIPFVFDIAYENDHHQAIAVLRELFQADTRILNAEHMEIGIKEFGDNSVRIAAFPLIKNENYLAVFYDTMSAVKDAFDAHDISIPYPQRTVHIAEYPKAGIDESVSPLQTPSSKN